MTLKKALLRSLLGIPIGVFIGYTITVVLSLCWGQGWYAAVVPAVKETAGSEAGAVALQYVLLCVMGYCYALASCIWKVERWSLTRQTVSHLLLVSLTTLPIVLVCHWADYIPGGVWTYFAVFAVIYGAIWLCLTASTRKKVRAVNEKLRGR